MTVTLNLTSAGTDTGPFDLYSDVDGYLVPFETNINKSNLQAGYTTSLVPDFTNIVRIKSTGICTNHFDVILNLTTTTTTTLLPLTTYCFQSVWLCPDPIHEPEINSWVDYIDEFGIQKREIIGCNGCICVNANSIINTNGVAACMIQ